MRRWQGQHTFQKVNIYLKKAGSDTEKALYVDVDALAGTKGFRQGAINVSVERASDQAFAVGWDGNDDCGVKIISRNRANNLDGATRIGGARALNIQARNSGTNLSWVKTMELNARNDSGKNVSELHGLHIRAENYGNVYTDIRGVDVEISDENTGGGGERMGIVIRSTDLSGMGAVDEVFKILHTSTNGFTNLINFAGATGDTAVANTHSIDGHALAFIARCKHNSVDGYIPFFAAVPS